MIIKRVKKIQPILYLVNNLNKTKISPLIIITIIFLLPLIVI